MTAANTNGPVRQLNHLFGRSRIGLGCMALSGLYGKVDRRQAISTIHAALDLGIRHFDTAELYGPYTNEELLAEALSKTCNAATVATKFGYKIISGRIEGRDSRPDSIRKCAENSLKRLNRDRIDLYYQHRPDPDVPIEDVIGTMADLRSEGKIDAAGLSGVDASVLDGICFAMPITAVQNEFSVVDYEAFFDRPETIFVAHSPLARGLLSSRKLDQVATRPDDFRNTNMRFQSHKVGLASSVKSRLTDLSYEYGVEPAVIAIAAVLARSPRIAVIPGAKSEAQIRICMQASELVLETKSLNALWQHLN
ncbi:MAG: aldo/keto reductase [Rhizobiaceae bacterium]|nr:aldo/keto reductase [Rhizobiaceae bacterium]